ISADGRFVAFQSGASNLVPDDTNQASDVFAVDLSTGNIQRLSVTSTCEQANGASSGPEISADGTTVTFASDASNLVSGDTNGFTDIFTSFNPLSVAAETPTPSASATPTGPTATPTGPTPTATGPTATPTPTGPTKTPTGPTAT